MAVATVNCHNFKKDAKGSCNRFLAKIKPSAPREEEDVGG